MLNNIVTLKSGLWVTQGHRPALSAGTRVSFTGNCKKQKPQID